ncbi:hypothetical protein AAIP36_000326 [Flavobacterium psychrophilum]
MKSKRPHLLKGVESSKGKSFATQKQNINKKGQPRKSFGTINEELRAKGVEPLTKSQFIEAYTLIFNSTDAELKDISKDLNVPLVLRLIIQELSNTKTRSKALVDYRDYMFGRAEQKLDLKIEEIKPIEFTILKNKE